MSDNQPRSEEAPLQTIGKYPGPMWCETCSQTTIANWTVRKIYRNGKEVERQECGECKNIQETEYFKGSTTRIENREES